MVFSNKIKQLKAYLLVFILVIVANGCTDAYESSEADSPLTFRVNIINSDQNATRATVDGEDAWGENTIDCVELLIFDASGSRILYQKHSDLKTNDTYTATVNQSKGNFILNDTYRIYAIANCPVGIDLNTEATTLNDLKSLTYVDEVIYKRDENKRFLMDGILEEIINDGSESSHLIDINLKRAAAKIQVNVSCPADYESSNNIKLYSTLEYGFFNFAKKTTLTGDVIPDSEWVLGQQNTFPQVPQFEAGLNKGKSFTVYSFASDWSSTGDSNNSVYAIINLPYTKVGTELRINNFFKIPINFSRLPQGETSEINRLKRNYFYEITAIVNKIGSEEAEEPIELDTEYKIGEWKVIDIDVAGGNDPIKSARYLVVNEKEINMNDITFYNGPKYSASDKIKISDVKITYNNNMGQLLEVTDTTTIFNLNVLMNTPQYNVGDTSKGYIRINKTSLPDELNNSESGNLEISSYHLDIITNEILSNSLLVKKIEFTVTLDDGASPTLYETITVTQYPAEYATNTQGWFSFKTPMSTSTSSSSNWGAFRQVNLGTNGIGAVTNMNQGYRGTTSSGIFTSRVVKEYNIQSGKSTISNYGNWGSNKYPTGSNFSHTNAHIYSVRISKQPSDNTSLGYIDNNKSWSDINTGINAGFISPFFMIASQLGAASTTSKASDAFDHCKQYVEVTYKKSTFSGSISSGVYKNTDSSNLLNDWVVYSDWRLPTEAELKIIASYQNDNGAVAVVLAGSHYWGITGNTSRVSIPNHTGSTAANGNAFVRCVRDVKPGDPNFNLKY